MQESSSKKRKCIKNAGKMRKSLLTLIDLFQWKSGSEENCLEWASETGKRKTGDSNSRQLFFREFCCK